MRKEYDFSKAKKNPYAILLKKQVTIRLDEGTIKYFKELATAAGIPYQTLINLYLRIVLLPVVSLPCNGKKSRSRGFLPRLRLRDFS